MTNFRVFEVAHIHIRVRTYISGHHNMLKVETEQVEFETQHRRCTDETAETLSNTQTLHPVKHTRMTR